MDVRNKGALVLDDIMEIPGLRFGRGLVNETLLSCICVTDYRESLQLAFQVKATFGKGTLLWTTSGLSNDLMPS